MNWIEILALRHIEGAIEQGAFDDLPGRGRPLAIAPEPDRGLAWDAGMHILRNAGMRPPWLDRLRALEQRVMDLRSRLMIASRQRDQEPLEWLNAWRRASEEIVDINRAIDQFNSVAPALCMQRRHLCLEKELGRAEERTSRNDKSA